jgi:hypothetical protein
MWCQIFFNSKHKNNLKKRKGKKKRRNGKIKKEKNKKTCLGARYLHHPPENRADLMRHGAGKPL